MSHAKPIPVQFVFVLNKPNPRLPGHDVSLLELFRVFLSVGERRSERLMYIQTNLMPGPVGRIITVVMDYLIDFPTNLISCMSACDFLQSGALDRIDIVHEISNLAISGRQKWNRPANVRQIHRRKLGSKIE